VKKLGEGSFSQVYQVIEKSSGALFALKVMEKEGLRELQVVDRLASELKIQHFCNHVNIAKLYGVIHDESRIYLIQEYSGSKTLFSFMEDKRDSFSLKDVQSIVRQICSAVRYLHNNYIIHRDIKPENILLAPGGVVKLTDFGWSIHNPGKTLRETICGTPLYLSPELISAEKYDQSVDMWAIGVLTY
jgi:aurora kinase, other